MASVKDSFIDLERHRQLLEQNVVKLEEALDEWRQWKTEYATLQKQVRSLPADASRDHLAAAREAYQGDLVNDKELKDIFGSDDSRNAASIISLLANRIDYVSKNVESLAKQLEAAENKLAQANVISNPEAVDEGGLPITEIMEELDDDDNIVSYSLRTPGDNQPQLMEALQKAGLAQGAGVAQNSGDTERPGVAENTGAAQKTGIAYRPKHVSTPSADILRNELKALENAEKNKFINGKTPRRAPQNGTKPKKGVTFAEDTKVEDGKPVEELQRTKNADKIEELLREAKEQESILSDPVIPTDESEEDAQLRRDMLQYNLSELNPVVAELTLEEGDISGDDFESDDYSDLDDEDDDEEDQWGRSTKSVVDDEYRQKMIEIQDRLSQQMVSSSSTPYIGEPGGDPAGIGRITVKVDESSAASGTTVTESSAQEIPEPETLPSGDTKKSVRFAPALDIAKETGPAAGKVADAAEPPSIPFVEPLSETIVERKPEEAAKSATPPTKKTSRFKKDRTSGPPAGPPLTTAGVPLLPEQFPMDRPVAPSGPDGKTLSESVIERESADVPKGPDELDAGLLQQEVATEYHKMRNKMIQRQGGFMKEDENPIQPLDEEEGGPKRMSRFRAARLARS